MKSALLAWLFCLPIWGFTQKANLSGTIKDAQNGEVLIGASVFISELKRGVTTTNLAFILFNSLLKR